jgi:hypothetical protein
MRSKLLYGISSLIVIIALECFARLQESSNSNDSLFNYFFLDEQMRRSGLIKDGGFFEDGYELQVNNRGFRDNKEWLPTSVTPGRRIILGAAGHGYGENLSDGLIYAQLLEKELQKENKHTEVYNLSVQGSTILFFERALLEEVISAKPDVVILSYSGFNEALYTSLPETSVLYPNNRIYNVLMSSSLIRQLRLYIASLNQRVNRVSPLEMIESYGNIIDQLQTEGIEVLILQQVVMHPDIDGLWKLSDMETYRLALKSFAQENNILLADPLSFCPELERCFEKQEWYSDEGHIAAFKALQKHQQILIGDQKSD